MHEFHDAMQKSLPIERCKLMAITMDDDGIRNQKNPQMRK